MPELVIGGLRIQDVRARRIPFRRVRINQIFYAEGRWYQRISPRKGMRADTADTEAVHFKQATIVRVLAEDGGKLRQRGMSYDEFINQAVCE